MSTKQKTAVRPKCRKMAEEYKDIELNLLDSSSRTNSILIEFDDESYFTKANTNIAGNGQFYSNDVEQTPDNVKNTSKAKYDDKVLLY